MCENINGFRGLTKTIQSRYLSPSPTPSPVGPSSLRSISATRSPQLDFNCPWGPHQFKFHTVVSWDHFWATLGVVWAPKKAPAENCAVTSFVDDNPESAEEHNTPNKQWHNSVVPGTSQVHDQPPVGGIIS